MRVLVLACLSVFAVTAGAASGGDVPADQDTAKDDLDRLQGVWQCVTMEANGQRMGFPKGRAPAATFKGGKVIFAQRDASGGEGKGPETLVKLDPSRDPKEIDIGDKGDIKGIYSVEGDTLKVMHVIAKRGQPVPKLDRPKGFAPKAGDGYVYMELKRVKQ